MPSCQNNNNRLQERYLRVMYNEKQSSFKALLEKDVCFFHEENIKIRATETLKNNNNLAPLQMHKISN